MVKIRNERRETTKILVKFSKNRFEMYQKKLKFMQNTHQNAFIPPNEIKKIIKSLKQGKCLEKKASEIVENYLFRNSILFEKKH